MHFLTLADSTYAQYRSELRSSPDTVDWMGVLGLVHEVVARWAGSASYARDGSRCHGQGLLPSWSSSEPAPPTGSAGSEGS